MTKRQRARTLVVATLVVLSWLSLAEAADTPQSVKPARQAQSDELLTDPYEPYLGQWWTPGFGARTRVDRCGHSLCARIAWLWDGRDATLGKLVLSELTPDPSGGFTDGKAFNPEDGQAYSASAKLLSAHRLLITGCILFICREQVWLRVRNELVTPHRQTIRANKDTRH